MIDAALQQLIDAPLADALKINLPSGKRPTPRSVNPVHEDGNFPAITPKELHERRKAESGQKIVALLDYYGTTTVPFARLAEHMNMPLNQVTDAMKRRGRAA